MDLIPMNAFTSWWLYLRSEASHISSCPLPDFPNSFFALSCTVASVPYSTFPCNRWRRSTHLATTNVMVTLVSYSIEPCDAGIISCCLSSIVHLVHIVFGWYWLLQLLEMMMMMMRRC